MNVCLSGAYALTYPVRAVASLIASVAARIWSAVKSIFEPRQDAVAKIRKAVAQAGPRRTDHRTINFELQEALQKNAAAAPACAIRFLSALARDIPISDQVLQDLLSSKEPLDLMKAIDENGLQIYKMKARHCATVKFSGKITDGGFLDQLSGAVAFIESKKGPFGMLMQSTGNFVLSVGCHKKAFWLFNPILGTMQTFPKSHDLTKAILKLAPEEGETNITFLGPKN